MKIPCVRCGKKIDSPHVYCRECSRELEDGAENLAAPQKRRRWPLLLLLLLLVAAGVYGYGLLPGDTLQQKLARLKTDVPTVEIIAEKLPEALTPDALLPPEEPSTPPESTRPDLPVPPEQSEQAQPAEDEIILDAGKPDAPADIATSPEPGPEPDAAPDATDSPADETAQTEQADAGQETDAPAEAPADTTDIAAAEQAGDEAAPTAEKQEEQAQEPADDAGQDATAQEQPEAAENQQIAEPQEPQDKPAAEAEPEPIEDGIWVFWMDKEDADKTAVARLQEQGYVNSVAKGQWPGRFNDKNIFYRHEDQRGLERLREALPGDNYYDYFYNNERIGQNVKRIFHNHEDVMFVIILQ